MREKASIFCKLVKGFAPATYLLLFSLLAFEQAYSQRTYWANEVVGFSSQSGEKSFSADQILGKPSKLTNTGMSTCAWMPDLRSRKTNEWIKVSFEDTLTVRQIAIAEFSRLGLVSKVMLYNEDGETVTVYENTDSVIAGESGQMLHIFPEKPMPARQMMVVVTGKDSVTVHQIDAIAIANHKNRIEAKINLAPPSKPVDSDTPHSEPVNLGANINSFYDEVLPVISPDGKFLYFDRKNHPHNTGETINDDIWVSELGEDGKWKRALNVGAPLNTNSHNFICTISPDGNTMLLGNVYNEDGTVSNGLSLSHRSGRGWSFPKAQKMRDYYNRDIFGEFHMGVNGKTILMAIKRDDTHGKRDLYVSFLMPNGTWSAPQNLGKDVNTAGLEMSPFLASDMQTLYFSSNGHPGYGKNDMFMSKRLDDSWKNWSEPQNLGPMLNSEDVDAYYTITAKGDYAYFASKAKAYGRNDIFRIELPEEVQPEPVVMITGRVVDESSDQPIAADITYELTRTHKEAGIARSTAEEGSYQIILPYGEQYDFRAIAKGYYALNEKIDLAEISEYQEIQRDLIMIPIRKGEVIPLRDITFEVNKAILSEDSYAELDRAVKFLKQNNGLKIEVGGHTNNRCSEHFCRELSTKRAKTVAQYFTDNGVDKDRVKWVGYGSTEPIADNATQEGRSANQRVEFKIVEIE